jgi:hypothetical protein
LKASDIGLFEPTEIPDAAAAMLFIDNINDAVKQYGEDRVLLIMKRCCSNAVALSWLTSLDEADRNELLISIPAWERLLRRDFMPKLADLEAKAKDEVFKWSQQRLPSVTGMPGHGKVQVKERVRIGGPGRQLLRSSPR